MQSDRSRPDDRPGGSGRCGRAGTKDARNLAEDRPERENPLNAPLMLLDAADGPFASQLEIVLQYIDELPVEFKATFEQHFDTAYIDTLRRICSGLKKLHENQLPTEGELDSIAHPHGMFSELTTGLRAAAVSAPIPLEREIFVKESIVGQLTELSRSFLPDPAFRLVRWWLERLQDDPHGPYSERTPAEP